MSYYFDNYSISGCSIGIVNELVDFGDISLATVLAKLVMATFSFVSEMIWRFLAMAQGHFLLILKDAMSNLILDLKRVQVILAY
jgi:hypothetical protein